LIRWTVVVVANHDMSSICDNYCCNISNRSILHSASGGLRTVVRFLSFFIRFDFSFFRLFIFFIIFPHLLCTFMLPLLLLLILPFYLNMPHMQNVAELPLQLLFFLLNHINFLLKINCCAFFKHIDCRCMCVRCVFVSIKIGRWLIIAFLFNLILLAHKFLSSNVELSLKNDYFCIRVRLCLIQL